MYNIINHKGIYNRVICKRKANETLGLVPNHEFMRTNTSPQVFPMLTSSYTKSGVGLLKFRLSNLFN
jgi:hypothetical protein